LRYSGRSRGWRCFMHLMPTAITTRLLLLAKTGLAIAGLSLFAASMSRCSPGATAPAIGVGERREAALSSSDSDGRVLHRGPEARWSFHGLSGQRISILAESYEFDVCLVLLDSQNQRVAFAEDNAGFFNARLNQVLKRDETLTIVVAGTNVDQAGTYWLTVD